MYIFPFRVAAPIAVSIDAGNRILVVQVFSEGIAEEKAGLTAIRHDAVKMRASNSATLLLVVYPRYMPGWFRY